MRDALTDDIRRTLHSAADRIDITTPPFGELGATPSVARHAAPRWVWPVAAAAAVIAVAVIAAPSLLPRSDEDDDGAAPLVSPAIVLTVTDSTADIGGVRFPVPAGWTVAVGAGTADAVTVCAAEAQSAECDGVQIMMSVPDAAGVGKPLPFGPNPECGAAGPTIIRLDESLSALSGRPAAHTWSSCGPSGPEAHLWQLDDLTLQITTPPGRWAAEGAAVAAGLDLSAWPVQPGALMVSRSSATSATSGG